MVREKEKRTHASPRSIWDTPRIKAMLAKPFGAPIKLSRDEAIAVARASFGKGKDWPSGVDYVRQVRSIWRGLVKKRDG